MLISGQKALWYFSSSWYWLDIELLIERHHSILLNNSRLFFFSGPNNRRFIRRTAEHVKVMHHGLFSESETLGKNMQSQLEALEDVLCENGGEGSSSAKRKKVLTVEKPREADTVLVTSKQCWEESTTESTNTRIHWRSWIINWEQHKNLRLILIK